MNPFKMIGKRLIRRNRTTFYAHTGGAKSRPILVMAIAVRMRINRFKS